MVNWPLLKNPLNWATVILMLVLAGITGHLVLTYLGFEPARQENPATVKK